MDGKFRTLVPKGKFNKCCVYHKPPGYGVQNGHCSEVADNSYIYSMRSGQHRDTCAQYLWSIFGGL